MTILSLTRNFPQFVASLFAQLFIAIVLLWRFGSMEMQNGYDNSLQHMLLNLGGNVKSAGDNQNQPPNFSNYYEFLTENSSLDQKTPTHVFDSIFVPPAMSEFQTQLMLNNPGLPLASASSLDMDAWNSNPYMFNRQALPLVEPLKKFTSSQNQTQTLAQGHDSFTQEASGSTANVSRSRPRKKRAAATAPAPVFRNVTRQRVYSNDRKRKEKISENVKALQELLPGSVEGSEAVVMDKIIEYVKYLKLQMKDLSGSKLGVDYFPTCPFIFDKGDHHYHFHGKTVNESPEETLAKLLKMDKSAAIKFLKSKGLHVMPMTLAHSLP